MTEYQTAADEAQKEPQEQASTPPGEDHLQLIIRLFRETEKPPIRKSVVYPELAKYFSPEITDRYIDDLNTRVYVAISQLRPARPSWRDYIPLLRVTTRDRFEICIRKSVDNHIAESAASAKSYARSNMHLEAREYSSLNAAFSVVREHIVQYYMRTVGLSLL